jgi:hypothetical protein
MDNIATVVFYAIVTLIVGGVIALTVLRSNMSYDICMEQDRSKGACIFYSLSR